MGWKELEVQLKAVWAVKTPSGWCDRRPEVKGHRPGFTHSPALVPVAPEWSPSTVGV